MAKVEGPPKALSPLVQAAHTCACCGEQVARSDTVVTAACGHVMHMECYHNLVNTVPTDSDVVVACAICEAPVIEFRAPLNSDCDTCGGKGKNKTVDDDDDADADTYDPSTGPLSKIQLPPSDDNLFSVMFAQGRDLSWLRTVNRAAHTFQDLLDLGFKKAHLRDTINAPLRQLAEFDGVSPVSLQQVFKLTAEDFAYLRADVDTLKALGFNVQEAIEVDDDDDSAAFDKVTAQARELADSDIRDSTTDQEEDWEREFRAQMRRGFDETASAAAAKLSKLTLANEQLAVQKPLKVEISQVIDDGGSAAAAYEADEEYDGEDSASVTADEEILPYTEDYSHVASQGEPTTVLYIADRVIASANAKRQASAPLPASSSSSFSATRSTLVPLEATQNVTVAAKMMVAEKLRSGDLVTRAEVERRVNSSSSSSCAASSRDGGVDYSKFLATAVNFTSFGQK